MEVGPACEGSDPALFFPEGRGSEVVERLAKAVCRTCPLRQECLDLAMATERGQARWGIYGGLNGAERAKLARRYARRA